jgi:hypothetical protein
MIPILGAASVSRVKMANIRCFPVQDLPDALTKRNSEARLKRDDRENLSLIRPGRIIRFLSFGVARVVQFHPARNQTFPASLTPPGQNRSSAFAFHPGAEAELAFPGAF